MQQEYDVIVIGAGPVGENAADRAAQGGLSVAIVESELVGGECSYWACMPSKALLRSGEAVRAARAVDGARQAVTGAIDAAAVLRRRDSFASEWDDSGQVQWLESAGIDLVRGHGAITGERVVAVTTDQGETRELRARRAVVIATGSAARLPDIPGLAESAPWTNREATGAERIPPRLVIIGGGVVAAELATAFATLGSRVTMLVRSELLSGFEPFAGELVADSLRELGVDLRLGTSPSSVARGDDGIVRVRIGGADGAAPHASRGSGEARDGADTGGTATAATGTAADTDTATGTAELVEAEEILVATGRVPRTGDLGLETIGLEPGAWLDTDDTLLVLGEGGRPLPGEWLYAVGDVNHRALLTHQGKYQARAAGDAIAARANGTPLRDEPWGRHVATADHAAVPQVVFTDPPIASVGLTEQGARDVGIEVRAVEVDLGGVAGAGVHRDDYRGTARMVVDERRGVIVGATFVGPDVQELLHSATIAIVGEVPLERLWHAVPSFPTISEVWLRLLEAYGRSNEEL